MNLQDTIRRWMTLRTELAAMEAAAHPDIADQHGRTWTWWKGNLYRHCGMTAPRRFIETGIVGLPTRHTLTNPNYPVMCTICDPDRLSERRQP